MSTAVVERSESNGTTSLQKILQARPGYRLLNTKVVTANRRVVNEFVEMTRLEHDREVQEARKNWILDEILEGRFHGNELASCHILSEDRLVRVNGKHTSLVLSSLSDADLRELNLQLVIKRFEADTVNDAVALYNTYDSRLSAKSSGDVVQVVVSADEQLRTIPRHVMTQIVGAFAWGATGDTRSHSRVEKTAAMALDNIDFCLWTQELFKEGTTENCKKLRRSPVINGMWRLFNKCQRDATIFWRLVRDENGEHPSTPDRVLARFLNSHSVNHAKGAKGNAAVHPRQMIASCITAWNAWRRGETTALRYYADKPMPRPV